MSKQSVYDDDLDLGVEWWKPEKAGETIEFTVSSLERTQSTHTKKDGDAKVGVTLTGTDRDGVEVGWTAWSARAKRALLVDKPEVGDLVRVTFDGEEPMKGGLAPAKNWTVKVLRRKGEVELDEHGLPADY
jgi:hypothetical protein